MSQPQCCQNKILNNKFINWLWSQFKLFSESKLLRTLSQNPSSSTLLFIFKKKKAEKMGNNSHYITLRLVKTTGNIKTLKSAEERRPRWAHFPRFLINKGKNKRICTYTSKKKNLTLAPAFLWPYYRTKSTTGTLQITGNNPIHTDSQAVTWFSRPLD